MRIEIGPGAQLDIEKLVASRLLVQANSGGGKTRTLRRLLEQSHGKVQQLVIDPEGEYHTLRERFDYVLAAPKGGDTAAHPRTAALLAERLLQLGASAILDIYELDPYERELFVERFITALLNADRSLWHPVIVVLDEAHVFAAEGEQTASAKAVRGLASRGRKRGYCLVAATQRLAKLSKDVAAECNNVLVGRCTLDVDIKRARDLLGFTSKEDIQSLRLLAPGEFYAFGPAFELPAPSRIRVGEIQTTHAEAGAQAAPVPPPSSQIRKLLPSLADLPAEAEAREKDLDTLKKENAELRRQITLASKVPVLTPEAVRALEGIATFLAAAERDLKNVVGTYDKMGERFNDLRARVQPTPGPKPFTTRPAQGQASAPPVRTQTQSNGRLRPKELEIVNAIAEMTALGVARPSREVVGFLAGYSNLRSKGFSNAVGALRSEGLVDYPDADSIVLTPKGQHAATYTGPPVNPEDVQERVMEMLGGKAREILTPMIRAYPNPLPRENVAAMAGYSNLRSKGFSNLIGRLRTLGFIDYPTPATVKASPVLFLEA